MIIKEQIDADYITAYKSKDTTAKAALSSIKAAITVAEKNNGTWVATNDEIIKIINKGIKQREESIKMYETAGRQELVDKERDEMEVLKKYMPAQMTSDEITLALKEILQDLSVTIKNPQALVGKSIGEFNKQYQGRADIGTVKGIVNQLVEL
jgi:uncharacterized protein YqeY